MLLNSPRFELPPLPEDMKGDKRKMPLVCHFCGEVGHKAAQCPKIPNENKDIYRTPDMMGSQPPSGGSRDRSNLRPLDEVTCYRVMLHIGISLILSHYILIRIISQCGLRGHYANKCTKGHLAFLSNNQPANWRNFHQPCLSLCHPTSNLSLFCFVSSGVSINEERPQFKANNTLFS